MVRFVGLILVFASIGCLAAMLLAWLSIYQRAGLAGLATLTGGVGLGLILMADTTRLFGLVVVFLFFAAGVYGASYQKQQYDLNKYYEYKSQAREAREKGDQHQAKLNDFAANIMRQSLGRLKIFKDE